MEFIKTDEYIKAIQMLSEKELYIVGAGKYGEILGEYFEKHKIPWKGYIDKRARLDQVNRKPVYTYDEIGEGYYVISTYWYRSEVVKELENREVSQNHIIMYGNQDIFYDLYNDLINWKVCTERIKRFYKKHKERRCFIIGNGPSLAISDLERLSKEITFASNTIYALYTYTDWRPTYYCANDAIFCKQMMKDKESMRVLMDGCQVVFTSIMGEGIRYRNDGDMANQLFYMRLKKGESRNSLPCFSSDCSRDIYTAGSVTYAMLQLAVYMGFQKIYLLGMDFNYSVERHADHTVTRKENICNHMKEIEQEEQRFYKAISERHNENYMADVDLQLAGYLSAKQYADSHGIEIYNATRGGKLEVFPRVDFDELFAPRGSR